MKVSNFLALFKDYQPDDEVCLRNFLGDTREIAFVGRDQGCDRVVIEGRLEQGKDYDKE